MTKRVCPPHEKGCGGCRNIFMEYPDTLRQKQAAFQQLFPDAAPILPCEKPLMYRNKLLRTFANGRTDLYFGLYRPGTHQVVSVQKCLLEHPRLAQIANEALAILSSMHIPAYREDFHRGVVRHIQMRRAPSTGQTLVTLVTGADDFPQAKTFAEELMRQCEDVRGVLLNYNARSTSAVLGGKQRVLAGKDEIWDKMGKMNVCLTSRTFYQVNTPQALLLYQTAVEAAQLTRRDTVLDAYCGVGLIGMMAAGQAGQVTGIEIVQPSIDCAVRAARSNRLDNISFLCGDAGEALRAHPAHYDAVFLDPPRAGCDGAFLSALVQGAPQRIVYISCCPETLRRDVDYLERHGYRHELVQPVDLFPYTEHVETVVLMSRDKE